MRKIFCFLLICSTLLATSDKERIADLTKQNSELLQQIKTSIIAYQSELVQLRKQVQVRSATADISNNAAAAGRAEARTAAIGQSDAIASVQESANTLLEIAQLKAASPINSVPVWLAAIALVGTFFGTVGTVVLAIVNHSKTSTIAEHVNGLNEKMGAAREEKGREEGRAENERRHTT